MTIVFVFEPTDDGAEKPISCPDVRKSPFVEYVVRSPSFGHHFRCITIDEAVSAPHSSAEFKYVFPIGVYRYFHLSWVDGVHSNSPKIRPLLSTIALLKEIEGIYLLIDLSWETVTQKQIDTLPSIAQALDFPIQNIILFSNNPGVTALSGAPANFGFSITGAWFFEFYVYSMHREHFDLARGVLAEKQSQLDFGSPKFEKVFLSLNRRMRHHRLLLAAFLHARGYLSDAFFSFAGGDASAQDNYMRADIIEHAKFVVEAIGEHGIIQEPDIDYILLNEPFELDVTFKTLRQDESVFKEKALATSNNVLDFYRKSLFSIVTETDFSASSFDFLLTEKTFKPILFGHPVIILSSPGALNELSLLGYRGFAPAFVEDYDKIYDPVTRFSRITESIDFAMRQSQSASLLNMRQLVSAARFNQENFIVGTPRRLEAFLTAFERELFRFRQAATQPAAKSKNTSISKLKFEIFEREFDRLLSTRSDIVHFDSGFWEYEPAHRGRWCSSQGNITIWLDDGDWEIVLFMTVQGAGAVPLIRRDGAILRSEYRDSDAKTAVLISLRDVRQFTTITCLPQSSFIPSQLDPTSNDSRLLSFWVHDDFLLRRLS